MDSARIEPLLQVPPFPGAECGTLAHHEGLPTGLSEAEVDRLFAAFQAKGLGDTVSRDEFRERAVDGWRYTDPFFGEAIGLAEAIDLCGFWQALIEKNHEFDAAVGFAFWKRETVAPLLWSGAPVNFVGADAVPKGGTVALWRSRTPPADIRRLEQTGVTMVEVEDGFIRSAGLGADCVPPLSIVVDRLGVHFDPTRPSELERLIEGGHFSPRLLERARRLRAIIVERGVSKYDVARTSVERRAAGRRHILVPGQVEDDRSILEGGGTVRTNFELLRRVREIAQDAYILYKPHPDIEAGHRAGAIPDDTALTVADEIVREVPIGALIAMVDEVHVNTSLAGFEALMREKRVTTHGVPFYAGWGLTVDLGEVPARRTARRTLDELVAAVLLEYPRYLDPVTGLPCPAEVVVERLSRGETADPNLIVRLRQVQGKVMRRLRSLIQ